MTALFNRVQDQNQNIEALNAEIKRLQAELAEAEQQLRVQSQRHEAQTTLMDEWKEMLLAIDSKAKDIANAFGTPDAVQDMLTDVAEIVADVTDNFEEHAMSDRYLNKETRDKDTEETKEKQDLAIAASAKKLPALTGEQSPYARLNKTQIKDLWRNLNHQTQVMARTVNYFDIPASITTQRGIANFLYGEGLTLDTWNQVIEKVTALMNPTETEIDAA